MAICGLSELKDYIGSTGTSYDSLFNAALAAAEREVLNYCHRSTAWSGFEASTGLTRYYTEQDVISLPVGAQYPSAYTQTVLWLGDADLLSVDTLTNGDATAISSTSYWLEPRNRGRGAYRAIRLRSGAAWSWQTDGEIAITGTWGYSSDPDPAIVGCVKETAKYLIDLRLTQTASITAMPDLGQLTIPQGMPKHVETVLRKGGYVRTNGVY
jgi:hypothetical protein